MDYLPTSLWVLLSDVTSGPLLCSGLQAKGRGLELTQESPAAKAARLTSTARQCADRAKARAQREQENQPPQAAAASARQQSQGQHSRSFTGAPTTLSDRRALTEQPQQPHQAHQVSCFRGLLVTLACLGLILAFRHSYKGRCDAPDVHAGRHTCSGPATSAMQHSKRHRASATGQPVIRVQTCAVSAAMAAKGCEDSEATQTCAAHSRAAGCCC